MARTSIVSAPVIGRALHGAEQHVGGLDVAVHDSLLVQRGQAEPDLADHLERLVARQAAGLEPVGERALVGVPHHQVGPAVVELAGVVDGHDVRRLDLAQEPALVDEPLLHVVVVGPVVGEHLDGDRGVEAARRSRATPWRNHPSRCAVVRRSDRCGWVGAPGHYLFADDPGDRTSEEAHGVEPDDIDDLARRAKAGDRDALEALLTAVRPRTLAICRGVLPYTSDAEDACQEALLNVATKIGGWGEQGRFTTWLHVVAVNSARSTYRRLRNQAVASDVLPAGEARPAHHQRDRRHPPRPARRAGDPRAGPPAVRRAAAAARRLRAGLRRDRPAGRAPRSGTVKAQIHHGRKLVRPMLRGSRVTRQPTRRPRLAAAALLAGLTACSGDDSSTPRRAEPAPTPAGDDVDARRGRGPDDLDAAVSEPVEDSVYPDVGDPSVDALHYDLDLAWDPELAHAHRRGGADVPLDRPRPTTSSSTWPSSSRCRRSQVDGEDAEFEHTRQGPRGRRRLRRGRARTSLTIAYSGTPEPVAAPTTRADFSTTGFTITDDGSAWTMQEPYGAYTWYAVNDQPSDKAFYDFTLRAPAPWTGVANGVLTSHEEEDGHDGQRAGTSTAGRRRTSITVAFGDYKVTEDESSERRADHVLGADRHAAEVRRRASRSPPEALAVGRGQARPLPVVVARRPARRLHTAAWRPRR